MSFWVNQSEDDLLPKWLMNGLSKTCQYCGSEMMNYYNEDLRCTNRRCSNPKCSGMIAARADFVIKLLNIKGIGFATCLNAIRGSGVKDQVELLSVLNIHPTVTLYTYLRMHCFEGVDGDWEKICKRYDAYTLNDLYNAYDGKHRQLLLDNKELLEDHLKYVELVQRPVTRKVDRPVTYLTIMITGTPIGYDTKDAFVDFLNTSMQGLIVVLHQRTKRQTGVDYLIREPGSTTRGKVEAAIKGGIPIVTSQEFIGILVKMLQDINAESQRQLGTYIDEQKGEGV